MATTGIPAHCNDCGAFFISPMIGMAAGATVTLSNMGTNCPNCGGSASFLDGTFDFVGNALRISNPSPRALAILSALQEALRAANAGKPVEEAVAPLQNVSP